MNSEQLCMAMAMLDITVRQLAAAVDKSPTTITSLMKARAPQQHSRAVVKRWLEGQGVVFIDATEDLGATVARRK